MKPAAFFSFIASLMLAGQAMAIVPSVDLPPTIDVPAPPTTVTQYPATSVAQ